jgi:hypothetical protein
MKKLTFALVAILFITFSLPMLKSESLQQADNGIIVDTDLQCESLDDLIGFAESIVVGTVVESEFFSEDSGADKNIVKVNKCLKGEAPQGSIDVYENAGILEVGKEYLLFLWRSESSLYPKPIYSPVVESSGMVIDGDSFKGSEKFVQGRTVAEMIDYILSSPRLTEQYRTVEKVRDNAKDFGELVSLSDTIIRVVPQKIIISNQYVARVKVKLLEQYKGDKFDDSYYLLLPPNTEVDTEYLIFLRKKGWFSKELTTRYGSMVKRPDDAEWAEAMNVLEINL